MGNSIFSRIYNRIAALGKSEVFDGIVLEQPAQPLSDELVQSRATIDLPEQMRMIGMVEAYLDEYEFPEYELDPSWNRGFALNNEIFVSQSDEPICRSNMDVFFQDRESGEKKQGFLVSLVRFDGDDWKVFQVREVVHE